jgi:proteasome accessory factor A
VQLLQEYQQIARAELRGRDTETDVLLDVWAEVLRALATDPEQLVGKVDWITKRWLLRQFCEQENIPWSHPWLKSQDLEFHQIDPARSLGLALAQTPPAWEIPPREVTQAACHPPGNTRAAVRSRAMRLLQEEGCAYYIDWEVVGGEGGNSLHMLNPFDAGLREAEHWMRRLSETPAKNAHRGKVATGT